MLRQVYEQCVNVKTGSLRRCVEHRCVSGVNPRVKQVLNITCASCLGVVEQCLQLGVKHVEHLPKGGVNVEQLNSVERSIDSAVMTELRRQRRHPLPWPFAMASI